MFLRAAAAGNRASARLDCASPLALYASIPDLTRPCVTSRDTVIFVIIQWFNQVNSLPRQYVKWTLEVLQGRKWVPFFTIPTRTFF